MRSSLPNFITLLLLVPTASAEPVVLGRETDTVSAEPWREHYRQTLAPAKQTPDSVRKQNRPDSATFMSGERFLPIRSPSLTPGSITPSAGIKQAPPQPLCLVGADALSLEWIKRVKPRLVELKARCLIVQVETGEQLTVLREALHPLPTMTASGEFLAQHHGIRHYPVLISRQGIEQ